MAEISDPQLINFLKNWSNLSVSMAKGVVGDSGGDINDPTEVTSATQSDEFKRRAVSLINNKADDRFLQRFSSTPPQLGGTETEVLSQMEQERLNAFKGQSILSQRIADKTADIVDFDESSFKEEQLRKLKPAEDIDKKILQLRFQSLAEEADIRSNDRFSHLSPAQKQRIIDSNRQANFETVSSLTDIRNARIRAAESNIQDEIDQRNERITSARSAVSALKEQESQMEKTGRNREGILEIRQQRLQLEKKMKKEGPSVETWQTVAQFIAEEIQRSGYSPTKIKGDIEIQAKRIFRLIKEFPERGGSFEGLVMAAAQQAAIMLIPEEESE